MTVEPVRNLSPYIQKYSKPLPASAPNPIFRGEAKPSRPARELSLNHLLAQSKFQNMLRDYAHKMKSIKPSGINVHQYKNIEMLFDGRPQT